MKQALCSISSNAEVIPGAHLMWIEAPDIAPAAQAGQFVTVRCEGFTLRRPFSIHQSRFDRDSGKREIALLFKVAGKGTLWLSQRKAGERIDIFGPLGKGFTIAPESRNLLLVAGGIGIAPLAFLAQQVSSQHQVTLIHGARTAAQLCYDSCHLSGIDHQRVQFIPVTEDGSASQKGKATDILPDYLDWADQLYACGPVDMYKTISLTANSRQLTARKCQVSLEVRMGCGFGACYGCTIDTKEGPKLVCRDGPVFELGDIIWPEVSL
jgi:dihydroorotate dehydrogenase electron transfer subunit